MIRSLFRTVLLVVIVVGIAAFFFGYRWGGYRSDGTGAPERPAATSGTRTIDTTKAREAGAEVGEVVAKGANDARRAAADATLTAKIKAKMALDDTVKALSIDVDTNGSVVTLTGTVHSEAERAKAVQLARDTDGVTTVNDKLVVK